jgi:hypothetical protein
LVKDDFLGNRHGILSRNFGVEPVVKVVTRWTVVKETESRKSDETFPVERSTTNEKLIVITMLW